MEIAQHMNNGQQTFSEHAKMELKNYSDALRDIMNLSVKAFVENDIDTAIRVEPLEEVIDYLHSKVKRHHIKRLQEGKCTIELGIDLEDLITNYERTADHCSNIAVGMLQTKIEGLEAHEYIDDVKKEAGGNFRKLYQEYKEKYVDNL